MWGHLTDGSSAGLHGAGSPVAALAGDTQVLPHHYPPRPSATTQPRGGE